MNNLWFTVGTILFLILGQLQPIKAQGVTENNFVPTKKILYKSVNDTTNLYLHVFEPEGHRNTDNAPAIIFFFGGGWVAGTPKQFYEQAAYYATKGIVSYCAEYRVKKRNNTSPFECVMDGKSAIRWVRKNAQKLGVNPNKIIAAGGSAGGHIAACTGIIAGYEEKREDLTISSVPNAMMLYNPVLDTTEKGYGMKRVGVNHKTAISPNHHIKEGIVPTIVFHGKADKTVPFENAKYFKKKMRKAGNDCSLKRYKGKGHGFFNGIFFNTIASRKTDKKVYKEIIDKGYTFLIDCNIL